MSFAPNETLKEGTDRTRWIINQTAKMSFSKRLAWLIREVGLDEFFALAVFYGCTMSRQRFQRLASKKQKLLRYKTINFISPTNLAAIKKALDHAAGDFCVTYSILLDGTLKERRGQSSYQLESVMPVDSTFRQRLVLLRLAVGHPYRGTFAKELPTILFRRYLRIELGKNGRDLIRPNEYSEIRHVLGCSYSMLIEGNPNIKKGPG